MLNLKSFARGLLVTGAFLTLGAAVACTDDKPATPDVKPAVPEVKKDVPTPPPTPVAAQDPTAEAATIFASRCVLCHGAGGKGDGVVAAGLEPKPRDMTSAEWQASVTDEHLAKVIVGGGPSVGLSALMPPNPDLAEKKPVVDALVKLVREMKK